LTSREEGALYASSSEYEEDMLGRGDGDDDDFAVFEDVFATSLDRTVATVGFG
jgi:hypothetical protein